MKANFILTKNTVHLFLHRFKKMLNVTGMIEEQSFYTGRKAFKTLLNKIGVKHHIEAIDKTLILYVDKDTVEYDSYPGSNFIGTGDGIIIRPNDDSAIVLYFGQKIKFTPNRIICIGDAAIAYENRRFRNIAKTCGSKTIFKVSSNVAKGKQANYWSNRQSKIYWQGVANGDY